MVISINGGIKGGFMAYASLTGINWRPTGRLTEGGPHIVHISGFAERRILKWTWSNVVQRRGQTWIIAAVSGEPSGDEVPAAFRIAVAPLDQDGKSPAALLRDATPAT